MDIGYATHPGPYPGFFWGVLSSTEGARIEVPSAPRGWGVGRRCPLPAEKILYFKYENDAFGGVGVKIRLPVPPIKKGPRFHALITIG
jgi:hypothetical protein